MRRHRPVKVRALALWDLIIRCKIGSYAQMTCKSTCQRFAWLTWLKNLGYGRSDEEENSAKRSCMWMFATWKWKRHQVVKLWVRKGKAKRPVMMGITFGVYEPVAFMNFPLCHKTDCYRYMVISQLTTYNKSKGYQIHSDFLKRFLLPALLDALPNSCGLPVHAHHHTYNMHRAREEEEDDR